MANIKIIRRLVYNMMRLIYSLCYLLFPFTAFAQNANNFLDVNANTTLNFIFDEPSDIETTQTIPNAISIQVRSKEDKCFISAKISSFTHPSSYINNTNMIALDWISDNSHKDYNLNTGPITLSSMDQILFNQNKHPHTYTYNYNLLLYPTGYNMTPGNYSFTILFTMTQL